MPRTQFDPAIAEEVATALWAVEEKLDVAFQDAARFTALLSEARMRGGVSVMIGQGAMESMSQAVAIITQARRALVTAHQQLAEDQLRLGIRTRMGGPFLDKDPPKGALEVVRDIAA